MIFYIPLSVFADDGLNGSCEFNSDYVYEINYAKKAKIKQLDNGYRLVEKELRGKVTFLEKKGEKPSIAIGKIYKFRKNSKGVITHLATLLSDVVLLYNLENDKVSPIVIEKFHAVGIRNVKNGFEVYGRDKNQFIKLN